MKRKEPTSQICMILSLGCVGVREREQTALQKEILHTVFSQFKRKKIRKRITTPNCSSACTSLWECNYTLLYLRAIQTIIIPLTLKDSSR